MMSLCRPFTVFRDMKWALAGCLEGLGSFGTPLLDLTTFAFCARVEPYFQNCTPEED